MKHPQFKNICSYAVYGISTVSVCALLVPAGISIGLISVICKSSGKLIIKLENAVEGRNSEHTRSDRPHEIILES